MKQDVEIKTGENEAELNERCQNIYGPIRTDDEHIVSVIAELLGPDSYACELMRMQFLRTSLTFCSRDSEHLPLACCHQRQCGSRR